MNSREHELFLSVDSGSDETVLMLLNSGANVNWKDSLGRTALSRASLVASENIVNILINFGADVNNSDVYGYTPVYIASMNNRFEVVNLLTKSNADVNQALNHDGKAPIHIAALNENLEIAQILIDSGADITLRTHQGKSALDIATEKQNREMIELFYAAEKTSKALHTEFEENEPLHSLWESTLISSIMKADLFQYLKHPRIVSIECIIKAHNISL